MAVGVTSLKEFLVQNVFEDWTTMISKENWVFFPLSDCGLELSSDAGCELKIGFLKMQPTILFVTLLSLHPELITEFRLSSSVVLTTTTSIY